MKHLLAWFPVLAVAWVADCAKKDASRILRVGMDLSYPPFEMIDPSGKPAGISVDLTHALAKQLARPVEIVPMDFSGLIPALKSGTIDLIISSLTATEERRQSIDFSEPYAFIGLAVLVPKDSAIRTAADFRQQAKTVSVKAGTTGESWCQEHLPHAKRAVFDDLAACVLEVVQGRADAFLYDQITIWHYARENPATTRAVLDPVQEEQWSIGIAKNHRDLLESANEFLADFRARDGLKSLSEKYLADERQAFEEAGLPFVLR